eukprot:1905963-Prymnesium_polylepis.1
MVSGLHPQCGCRGEWTVVIEHTRGTETYRLLRCEFEESRLRSLRESPACPRPHTGRLAIVHMRQAAIRQQRVRQSEPPC